jgi:hypothetical protein
MADCPEIDAHSSDKREISRDSFQCRQAALKRIHYEGCQHFGGYFKILFSNQSQDFLLFAPLKGVLN